MLRHISFFLNHDKKQNEVNHVLFPVTMIVTNSFKPFPESKYQNLQKVLFRHCSIGNHKMLPQDWVAIHFSRKHKRGLNKKSVYCSITGLTEVLALVISINDKNEASIMHCNWWSLFLHFLYFSLSCRTAAIC